MIFLAKCMKCGADMHIDLTEKEVLCKSCLTPFIFERTMFNADMSAEAIILSKKVEKCDEKIAALQKDIKEKSSRIEDKVKKLKSGKISAIVLSILIALFVIVAVGVSMTTEENEIAVIVLSCAAALCLTCWIFNQKNEKVLIREIAPIEARIKINEEQIEELEAIKNELME